MEFNKKTLKDRFVSLDALEFSSKGHAQNGGRVFEWDVLKKWPSVDVAYGIWQAPFARFGLYIHEGRLIELVLALENDGISAVGLPQKTNQSVIDDFIAGLDTAPIRIGLFGTRFQMHVWQALMQIPQGSVTSYQTIAKIINNPKAVRAVGNAVGANRIAYFVPCHRVVAHDCGIGGFAWGVPLKEKMLTYELAQSA